MFFPYTYEDVVNMGPTLRSAALHGRNSGGERQGFLQAHPPDREAELRGEGADQSAGEGSCQSRRGSAGEDPEGDGGVPPGRR